VIARPISSESVGMFDPLASWTQGG
jgi:hypothetical protein